MGKYYVESNTESTLLTYNKRVNYRAKTLKAEHAHGNQHVVDFDTGDRTYHGKVNLHFSPIFLADDQNGRHNAGLKPVTSADSKSPQYAIDIVADLFEEMRLKVQSAVAAGKISANDPYLSNLKVYKSYKSPKKEYENYKKIMFNSLARKIRKSNIDITNFDDFIQQVVNIYPTLTKRVPITFAGFVKSRMNTVLNSGIALEIADLSHINDQEKIDRFYQSKNWKYFVLACNNYGFMIDYDTPWRIVCDISSPEIRQYIRRNGSEDWIDLLDNRYSKASLETLFDLPANLLELYNQIKLKKIRRTKICTSGKRIYEIIEPETYTFEQLMKRYNLKYFARIYMKLRVAEEKQHEWSEEYTYRIIKDVLQLCDVYGNLGPIELHFERFLNKPFDKKYSTGYYMNVVWPAIVKEQFARSEIDAYSTATLSSMRY